MSPRKTFLFTDKFLNGKDCKGRSNKFYLREGRGFTIRVLPSGVITFLYIYTINGNRRELNLGNYDKDKKKFPISTEENNVSPTGATLLEQLNTLLAESQNVTLAEARKIYNIASTLVADNIDPKAPPSQVSQAPVAAKAPDNITVSELKVKYINHIKTHLVSRSVKHHEERIDLHMLPEWGDRDIRSIRRPEAISLVEKIVLVGRGAARNLILSGRAMFEYAIEREYIESNPFHKISKAVPQARPKKRTRILKLNEISKLWKKLTHGYGSAEVRRILKLVLLLGQRPGEVAAMRYEHIHGDWWIIPKDETKNGKNPNIEEEYKCDHHVYLPPHAKELIGTGTGYVFTPRGTPVQETSLLGHVRAEVKTKNGETRKEPFYGLDPWEPHDLRRTMATQLVEIFSTPHEIIEAILGHIIPGVKGVYIHAKYAKQKKEYVTAWEKKVSEIVNQTPEEEQVSRPDLVTRRILSDEEIKTVWEGLSQKKSVSYNALKFILVTGQSPGKSASCHSNEIVSDTSGKWWTPKEGNRTFLSKTATELIGEPNGYAFSPRGSNHVNIATLSYHVLNQIHFGVQKWTPDDLRFTVASKIMEIGAPAGIVDAIVHGSPTNHWELRHWLEKWEQKLLEIIS